MARVGPQRHKKKNGCHTQSKEWLRGRQTLYKLLRRSGMSRNIKEPKLYYRAQKSPLIMSEQEHVNAV